MMQCDDAARLLDPYLDGELAEDDGEALAAHLNTCEKCASEFRIAGSVADSLRRLDALDVPSGAFDRLAMEAKLAAVDRGLARRNYLALAAAIVLGVTIILYARFEGSDAPANDGVRLSLRGANDIHLVLDAGHTMEGAVVTVSLPPEVEIRGYPGRRSLRWSTTLVPGKNRLTLPVVAVLDIPGKTRIVATVEYGDRSSRYAVPIELVDDTQTPPRELKPDVS